MITEARALELRREIESIRLDPRFTSGTEEQMQLLRDMR